MIQNQGLEKNPVQSEFDSVIYLFYTCRYFINFIYLLIELVFNFKLIRFYQKN